MATMCESLFSKFESASGDPAAMGPEERWLSVATGACLAGFGLSRIRLGALVALGAGAFLAYRGATGRCPLRARLAQRSGIRHDFSDFEAPWEGNPSEGPWERQDSQPSGATMPSEPADERALRKVDCVDEAAMESFPASDPPSYTGATATPSVRIE